MKQIIIDVRHSDCKVALLNDGILDEFWIERANQDTKLLGNIYKGKVVNVLQGMQACFVDIGRERNAFLFAGDVAVNGNIINPTDPAFNGKFPLKTGDIIMCQVLKEEFGNKGARVTMNISLPGRMLVMSPLVDHICISRRIDNETQRIELEKIVAAARIHAYGYIIRTEAGVAKTEEIIRDIGELDTRWNIIKDSFLKSSITSCIYTECDIVTRAIRDMLKTDINKIIVNDHSTIDKIKRDYSYICEERQDLIEYYGGDDSIYHHYGIFSQIEPLLKKKVVLSNGSYIVLDRTEALTVIDVNTGKYVGEHSLEQTVFVTNIIAAKEIPRQIRLRNISGIIIVDFIDMADEAHRKEVLQVLQTEIAKDRTKCTLISMTELGLVQITRKKARSMLTDELTAPCPYCKGEGTVFSEEFTILRIRDYLVELFNTNPHVNAVKLNVHPNVATKLFTGRFMEKECAIEWVNKRIYVIANPHVHVERYDVEKITDKIIDLPDTAKLLV